MKLFSNSAIFHLKMEDEECLPENSTLKLYLQNLGFTDFPIKEIMAPDPLSFKFEVSKTKTNSVETIDEDVVEQISLIISTQMIFEEDIFKVEKLLSNFKVVKNGMLKSMFRSLFGVSVIFLGLCLFWVIGFYAFFIVSSFYAFIAADYLTRKHFNRNRLKKLTSILQANFILLNKTLKFIEGNRSLETSFCRNNSVEYIKGFDFYNNFKADSLISIDKMIKILAESTKKLLIKLPLCDYIENPDFYLCNNLNKNHESINMSYLYKIYLLVQSEFLQRLILSLIPNIKLSNKDCYGELNQIITETCVNLLKLKNQLNKKYKFVFFNGIHSLKSEIQFKLPLKQSSNHKYSDEFMLNIHETSNTFQKLLLQSRLLEEKIISDKISGFMEQELVNMQQSLNICQKNITDSLILFKKANLVKDNYYAMNNVKIQDEKELKSSMDSSNKVVVGYSDFDPKIEDEVFEVCFSNENSVTNITDYDMWDLEENFIKKQKKEFSKNVMNELKVKLKEKAEYWKKREKELLKKKSIYDANECKESTETSDEEEVENNLDKLYMQKPSDCHKIFKSSEGTGTTGITCIGITSEFRNFKNDESAETLEIPKCQTQCENAQEIYTDENFFESVIINQTNSSNLLNESFKTDTGCESFTQNFNKNFLNDLNQARVKIFNSSSAVEESFYASGEDSS